VVARVAITMVKV
jgi:hypothetical protein